ncbi:DUF2206 domain-containing protein [Thermococcus barossii]|nr:DUF2206 domain-containing protein [Thermococcus barossii]
MVNNYGNNLLLLSTIIIMAGIILAIAFTEVIPNGAYPYLIFTMATSLIFHTTLITNYIQVQDVYGEYYIAQSVLKTHFWEYYVGDTPYNSVLSTTILPIIFHYISKVSLTWIYKIIFPTFLALIPLILYRIYTSYISPKMAFLSVVLFMGIHSFFITVPFIPKQVTAEVFLLLLLHVTFSREIEHRNFLLTVFGVSIVMSHYGTAYLVLGMLIFAKIWGYLTSSLSKSTSPKSVLSNLYIALYAIVVFGWYANMSEMISLSSVLRRVPSIVRLVASGVLFSTKYSRGASLLTKQLPLLGAIDKYLYLAIGAFSAVGLIIATIETYLKDIEKPRFDTAYIAFSVYWMLILGATILIPHFAMMNPYRLYHLSMITLSPFVMLGLQRTLKIFERFFTLNHIRVAGVILVVFVLLNTGALNEILRLPPFYSSSLNQDTALQLGGIEDKRMVYGRLITTWDVQSSMWISTFWNSSRLIYSNRWGYGSASLHSYGELPVKNIESMTPDGVIPKNNYIYIPYIFKKLRLWYTVDTLGQPKYFNATNLYTKLAVEYSIIYNNHGTQVLWS